MQESTLFSSIWIFINQNLISEIISAGIIATIVGRYFYKFQKDDTETEITNKVTKMVIPQLEENIKTTKLIKENLKSDKVHLFPEPFRISGFQIIVEGGFVENLNIDTAKRIIDVHDKLLLANKLHSQLLEYSIGANAAFSNSKDIRNALKPFLDNILDILTTELQVLKEILE